MAVTDTSIRSQLNLFPIQKCLTCQSFHEVDIHVAFLQAYQIISSKDVGMHAIHPSFLVTTMDNMTYGGGRTIKQKFSKDEQARGESVRRRGTTSNYLDSRLVKVIRMVVILFFLCGLKI